MKHQNEDLIAHFENYLLTEKRLAKNSFEAYTRDIRQLYLFIAKKNILLAKAKPEDLKLFLRSLKNKKLSAKSMARKISTIKNFFSFLEERFGCKNAAEVLMYPKVEKTLPLYLSSKEVKALLMAARSDETTKGIRNNIMVHLLYSSGMRVSELCMLTTDQIHFDTGFIQLIGKGNKERMVPLPAATLNLLRSYLEGPYKASIPDNSVMPKPFLFASVQKNIVSPITRQTVWNVLKSLLKRAGITKKVSPHSLRHSLATHLLNNGADIRSLQMLLGHENITTVQIYTHLETKQLRKIYDKKHPRS